MRKVNWGVIGTAGIAKGQTIPGMVLAENCYLYAIAGRKLEKAQEFQQLFGFEKAYGSYEELLADPKVEAVYIALPNTLHFEWVRKTLESGKHVLCEKPLVPSAQEAEELFRIASANGVYLMEAFAYLHSPWVAAIKNELEQGTVGKVRYIESQFVTSDYDMTNIRMRRETNGGAMYDLGCYTSSMITWLLGRQPDKIRAAADFSPEGIDLMTTAIFTYDDGTHAMMNCGMVLATGASRRLDQLRIEGTEGSIRSTGEFNGCGEMTYTVIRDGAEEVKTVSVPQNYCLETEQLGRCILDGEKPHVTAEFTVANLETIGGVLKEIGY
ncbi:MAG: Gfo/Idh/MocA family oxidoreductase [Lachnospiraceae bacterium]|nr:Gfo/Idh/MocA family oxidoreductase [Lachnospiraceae bacterium]